MARKLCENRPQNLVDHGTRFCLLHSAFDHHSYSTERRNHVLSQESRRVVRHDFSVFHAFLEHAFCEALHALEGAPNFLTKGRFVLAELRR